MRTVAFESSSLCRPFPSGVGRYGLGIIRSVTRAGAQYGFYVGYRWTRMARRRWLPAAARCRRIALPARGVPPPGWFYRWRKIDLFHALDTHLPEGFKGPMVATVYDLLSLGGQGFARPSFRRKKQEAYRAIAGCAHRIVVISERVRLDLIRAFPEVSDRVSVIYPGVDEVFRPRGERAVAEVLERHRIRRPYLVCVGEICRRKNLAGAVRVLEILKERGHLLELVLVGRESYGASAVAEVIRSSAAGSSIRLTGYVEDTGLAALYSGALVLLWLSDYEGFGLPLIEAMACGTPVIARDRGAAREVLGGAGILVGDDPGDAARAVEGITADGDLRTRLAASGLARARDFSWADAGRRVLSLYESLL